MTVRPWKIPCFSLAILSMAGTLFAYTPPWFRISLGTATTSNLFADSSEVYDNSASLTASLEQDLAPLATIYYYGRADGYSRNSGLGSLYHEGGAELRGYLSERSIAWISAGGSLQGYGALYEIYDQRIQRAEVGYRYDLDESVRIRGGGDWQAAQYPNSPDTLSVDFQEFQVYMGWNNTLFLPFLEKQTAQPHPLSLDFEAGLQRRRYRGDGDPTTIFGWGNLRLSMPLDAKTGVGVRLRVRSQAATDNEQLRALYTGGVDTETLLWDGWRLSASLTRLLGNWRLDFYADLEHSEYVETISTAWISIPPRKDHRVLFSLFLKRSIVLPRQPFLLGFSAGYSYDINDSSRDYYVYQTHSLNVTLSVELY